MIKASVKLNRSGNGYDFIAADEHEIDVINVFELHDGSFLLCSEKGYTQGDTIANAVEHYSELYDTDLWKDFLSAWDGSLDFGLY